MNTRPVRIRESESIRKAVEILAYTDCSDLMVVGDDGDAFMGILAEGDLLRAALPSVSDVLEAGGSMAGAFDLFVKRGGALSGEPVAPHVIREPIRICPDDHIGKIAVILV